MKIKDITLAPYNPRHKLVPGDPEYERLRRSIQEFGMVEPVVYNKRTKRLIGGHQRLTVLRDLGHATVDVSMVDLPEEKEKALNLALNKIEGRRDAPKLKDLLEELDSGAIDMVITGFDEDEIEELMGQTYAPAEIDDLLQELDLSKVVDKPIWAVIRTAAENQEILESVLLILEQRGIRVERSYETGD